MKHAPRTVVFLHGLGEGPQVWQPVIDCLPEGFRGVALPVAGTREADGSFSMDAAVDSVIEAADRRALETFDLCGLSLGAVVATQTAVTYGERVASLVISGGQVRPNPLLMTAQSLLMRMLPQAMVAPEGMSKARLLDILEVMSRVDMAADITRIAAPTLVMCGLRDRPNLPAARQLAHGIAGARLELVGGAGHQWHCQMPRTFSALLNAFLRSSPMPMR